MSEQERAEVRSALTEARALIQRAMTDEKLQASADRKRRLAEAMKRYDRFDHGTERVS